MKAAPSIGAERSPSGRARRFALPEGGELWRLPADADAIALRLVSLGSFGVGGFVDGGTDEHGPWMVRVCDQPTLLSWIREQPRRAWPDVLLRLTAVARRLAACESRSIGPGPILPAAISLCDPDPRTVHLLAPALVDALVGAAGSEADPTPSPRWMPPEAGALAWNHAANRYVLGLCAYRALCGHHPFSGIGLRAALDEQRERGAPPFPEAVARELPPGLHSLVLQMLAPDPESRPQSAEEIRVRLAAFAPGAESNRPSATRPMPPLRPEPEVTAAPEPAPEPPCVRSRRGVKTLASTLPWLAGIAIASTLSLSSDPPPSASAAREPSVRSQTPLTHPSTTADDCAGCHPRQAGQWHGSVMAHAVKSPLFEGLEILIQEQGGRSFDCPHGAGILRRVDGATACRDPQSGVPITGSGGEHWCVNCHAAGDNLDSVVPPWDAVSSRSASRRPLRDLLPPRTMQGISCAFCHQVHGPTRPGARERGTYEGNPDWTSFVTGRRFSSRPEDRLGRPGIANSGYLLDPGELLVDHADDLQRRGQRVPTGAHLRPTAEAKEYLRSSHFCGACHDVRLFGTDAIGVERGEHFKRLRNAYSEWVEWAADERAQGREPASCQDCHMSTYPGVCVPETEVQRSLAESFAPGSTALARACPDTTTFSPRPPGHRPSGGTAAGSATTTVSTHYFTGVDVPLSDEFPEALADDPTLDVHGIPRGAEQRRDMLLGSTFRFELDDPKRRDRRLELPIEIENVGAGHKVPAGFSQEREFWVHLRIRDEAGRVVYEVGRVDRDDEDLRDKVFVRVNVDDRRLDEQGRPLGVFGADVVDGPDVPRWSPDARAGGREFRGKGLINFQNGFLRCVTCIGRIDERGRCQPGPGQGRHRADRYADGRYDLDTGACISNLEGDERFFETYFPVGSLDAQRGVLKAPDAIIDTRSAPPGEPIRYVYDLDVGSGPLHVEARLLFRAFPPFLIEAFAAYEAQQAKRGLRPSGPLVTRDMLERLEVVELRRLEMDVP